MEYAPPLSTGIKKTSDVKYPPVDTYLVSSSAKSAITKSLSVAKYPTYFR